MVNHIPLATDVEAAVRMRAAKEGVAPPDLVNALLRQVLRVEIEEAAGTPPLAHVIQHVMRTNSKQT